MSKPPLARRPDLILATWFDALLFRRAPRGLEI